MTTIAFDGKTLAFDSRITENGMAVGSSDKGIETSQYIGAIAGDFVTIPVLRKWIRLGGKVTAPKFPKGTEFLMVLVDKETKQIQVYEDSTEPMVLDDKVFAAGTGAAYAYGAMHVGANSKDAVIAAAAYDGYTGGRVRTLEL